MKYTILSAVLSMGVLVGCSHMHDTKRIPASADKDQKETCGLSGSVDERIADCSAQGGFVLVSRSSDSREVHMDITTGLLWSDKIDGNMAYNYAVNACKIDLNGRAGIPGKTWRLPTIEEYHTANINGMIEALPNMNYTFVSSSKSDIPDQGWFFSNGVSLLGYLHSWAHINNNGEQIPHSVRCVAD